MTPRSSRTRCGSSVTIVPLDLVIGAFALRVVTLERPFERRLRGSLHPPTQVLEARSQH